MDISASKTSLAKRGRPARLPRAEMAEATSVTHADLRQVRRHLNSAAHGLREAYALLAICEQRLVPVIRELDIER